MKARRTASDPKALKRAIIEYHSSSVHTTPLEPIDATDPVSPRAVASTPSFQAANRQYGTYVEWNSNSLGIFPALAAAHPGIHINRTIWAYSDCSLATFVELGLWLDSGGGVHFYGAYSGRDRHQPFPQFFATAPLNGSHHYYWIRFDGIALDGSGVYSVWVDGVKQASYAEQGTNGTCLSQAGLEISRISCTPSLNDYSGYQPDACWAASDTTQGPLAWQDTSYTFHYGWDTNQYWIDWPCYPYTLLAPPNCIGGGFVNGSSSYWHASK